VEAEQGASWKGKQSGTEQQLALWGLKSIYARNLSKKADFVLRCKSTFNEKGSVQLLKTEIDLKHKGPVRTAQ